METEVLSVAHVSTFNHYESVVDFTCNHGIVSVLTACKEVKLDLSYVGIA